MTDPVNPVPTPIPPPDVPNPQPLFISVKDFAIKILKNWWVWIILILLVLLGLSECRHRSQISQWEKSIRSEVKLQTDKLAKDQQDKQAAYEKDLKAVQDGVKKLDKATKVIDSKLSKTGDLLSEIRNKKMSDTDIDRRLNELFGPPGNSMGQTGQRSGTSF